MSSGGLYVTNDSRTAIAWYKVYLLLTAVSTVLVGLTQAGVPPFGDLGSLAAAAMVVALFGVASLAYWYDVRRRRRRREQEPPDLLVSLDEEIPLEEGMEEDERGTDDRNGTGDDENGTGDDESETGGEENGTGSDENEIDGGNRIDDRNGTRDGDDRG